jgi:hypothetical protein
VAARLPAQVTGELRALRLWLLQGWPDHSDRRKAELDEHLPPGPPSWPVFNLNEFKVDRLRPYVHAQPTSGYTFRVEYKG